MKNHTPRDPGELRRQAEDQASTMEPASLSVQSPEEIQRVLHELQVHQIELELQNEELRTAQTGIEAGRARYYDLYDLAPVGYCTLSGKGLILEANLTAATLLGMSRSRLVKQPVSRFILKDDQDRYYLHLKKLLETNQAQECELRLLKPDGTLFWAHVTAIAAQADDGAPVARMTFSDITEHKRAEEELRKSEERYRAITDHSPAGVFQTDVQGDCTYVNPRWIEITGLTFDEALGNGWSQALHPEDKQRVFDGWYAAAIAGLPYDWESRFVTKQGKQSWITGHAEVLFDQHGNNQGYIGIIVDITERKRAEDEILKQLSENENLLREVNHRVKNNIANVEGLLFLQAGSTANPDIKAALQEALSRV